MTIRTLLLAALLTLPVAACDDPPEAPTPASKDGGVGDAAKGDGGTAKTDASPTVGDGAAVDANGVDAGIDAATEDAAAVDAVSGDGGGEAGADAPPAGDAGTDA